LSISSTTWTVSPSLVCSIKSSRSLTQTTQRRGFCRLPSSSPICCSLQSLATGRLVLQKVLDGGRSIPLERPHFPWLSDLRASKELGQGLGSPRISSLSQLLRHGWNWGGQLLYMVLYVARPTCRGTAETLQILLSHAVGDAGSPYLMGLLSDEIYSVMIPNSPCKEDQQQIPMKSNVTQGGLEGKGFFNGGFFTSKDQTSECENPEELFTSLQYSFFSNSGVEVLGGILFLASAIYS